MIRRYFAVFSLIVLLLPLMYPSTGTAKGMKLFHYRDKAIVLMYHNFGPVENDVTITANRFRGQIQALRQAGYHFITMNDFMMFKLYGNDLPDNAVLVTVDDGYESGYRVAYPILEEFGMKASFFVIVRSTDEPMKHKESLPHLTWAEMKEMKSNGHSFYSHTYGLHEKIRSDESGRTESALTGRLYDPAAKTIETDEQYKARVMADLELADRRLNAELGNKTKLLCFPYGSYNDEVLRIVNEEGVQLVFTTKSGINENDRSLLIKRVNAGGTGNTEQILMKKLSAYDEVSK